MAVLPSFRGFRSSLLCITTVGVPHSINRICADSDGCAQREVWSDTNGCVATTAVVQPAGRPPFCPARL